ncbi:MAG: hypothetical protein SPL49_09005 [Oribacterium sp.]|nr:hypothetical protein [Oribacterium sp.]
MATGTVLPVSLEKLTERTVPVVIQMREGAVADSLKKVVRKPRKFSKIQEKKEKSRREATFSDLKLAKG